MGWLASVPDSRFLALYWVLVGLAAQAAVAAPMLLPVPRPKTRVRNADLGPYELAMIAGGPKRVVDTALAGPGGVAPRDRVQRYVFAQMRRTRKPLADRDDLGVGHRGPGRALTRRLLSLGYLVRRRSGGRLHWLLGGVMALGLLRVVAGHGLAALANAFVVAVVLLAMLGMVRGIDALELRWSTGSVVSSRWQVRTMTGLMLGVCAQSVLVLAPDGPSTAVLASVLGTALVWWIVRVVLRRITRPVATPRGRQVVANIAIREPTAEQLLIATGDGGRNPPNVARGHLPSTTVRRFATQDG